MAKILEYQDTIIKTFITLVKTGLWADVGISVSWLNGFDSKDWEEVFSLAEEQSVQGLVLQGIECYKKQKPKCVTSLTQEQLLQLIGELQMIEQQNLAMNEFIAKLIEQLREKDVYAILVKGQGIAQCYEKPLWRSPGDIDLLLSEDNYNKAKEYLVPKAEAVETEYTLFKHYGLTIKGWVVELHGSLRPRLTKRINRGVDNVQYDVFYKGNVRSWVNGSTTVFLPSPDNDIIFIFTHILKHFYQGGIGLRQICDWCRLLWTYRSKLDLRLLESRIQGMGLMSEWRAFAALAVDYLGMPVEAMPLYSNDKKWSQKARKITNFIIEVGNFGHNRDQGLSQGQSFLESKIRSLRFRTIDSIRHVFLFPMNSLKVWLHLMSTGIIIALKK